jgi:hypothetical protein
MAVPNVFVVYTIQDAKGEKSTMKVNFGASPNLGMVRAWAEQAAIVISNVITGGIVDIGIGIGVQIPSAALNPPDESSDVEEGARFSWRTAIGSLTGFRIPTFSEGLLLPGTNQVDTSAIEDLTNIMISGHTVGLENIQPTDERGSDIESLETARESFQSSRS